MKKAILVILFAAGMFSSCGTQSKLPVKDLLMQTLTSALMQKDLSILKPFLSDKFSLGSLVGDAAISKGSSLLKLAPEILGVKLQGTEKSATGSILNTLVNFKGESEAQKSPINLDAMGKISSIGLLTNLLNKK